MSRKPGTIPEETKATLIASATAEFAKYGFQKSSLRRICAEAKVTTGALYFFFQDKDDLFSQVIAPVTTHIIAGIEEHYNNELTAQADELMLDDSADLRAGDSLLNIYYTNKTVVRIIMNHRNHPAVIAFFDRLTGLIDNQSVLLLKRLNATFSKEPASNEFICHWISRLQLDAFLHLLEHDFTEEQAKAQLQIMIRFLRGGFLTTIRTE